MWCCCIGKGAPAAVRTPSPTFLDGALKEDRIQERTAAVAEAALDSSGAIPFGPLNAGDGAAEVAFSIVSGRTRRSKQLNELSGETKSNRDSSSQILSAKSDVSLARDLTEVDPTEVSRVDSRHFAAMAAIPVTHMRQMRPRAVRVPLSEHANAMQKRIDSVASRVFEKPVEMPAVFYLWDADKIIASYEEKRDAIEKEWDPWVELSSKITIFDQEMMLGSSDNKVKGVADRFFDMMRRLSNAREGMDVYIENARETKRAMELSTTETYPIDPAFNAIAQAIFEEGLSRDKWIGKGGHAVVVANQYGGHEVAKKKNRDDIYYKNELEKAAHLFTAKNELEMATHLLAAKIKGVIHPLYFESKGVIVYPRCDHALDAEIGPKTSTNALDPKQFLFDLVGLLRTLDQLHVRAKVVHSDFKAGNILRKGDQLLIADFGLMGYAGARYEASTMLISAPELLVKRRDRNSNKEVYDFADLPLQPSQDIWALGILLCAALFQEYPFPLPMIESHFFVPENRADFGRVQEQIDRVIDLKFERLAIELMEKDLMETYCTLIKRILRVDPLERPTANALLEMDELKSYLARPAAADAVASDERPVASGAGDI